MSINDRNTNIAFFFSEHLSKTAVNMETDITGNIHRCALRVGNNIYKSSDDI